MAKTKAEAEDEKIRVEYMPLSEVKRWPRNPKQHDMDALGESMDRFGYVQPVLRDEKTGRLVAGHGRVDKLAALKEAGKEPPKRIVVKGKEWLIPVVRGVTFTNQAEAEAYLLADNRLVEIGGWDEELLVKMLENAQQQAAALSGLGWIDGDVERIIAGLKGGPGGPTPDLKAVSFMAGAIKQIIMYFDGPELEAVLRRMQVVMGKHKLESHTALLLFLLDFYENAQSRKKVA